MSGSSPTQDAGSEQAAEQRRRRRKERAAKARAPEPKDIVSGAGQPLDAGVRRELEEQLGHDLGRVRLHTGRDAGQLTELLGADAVAVGQDVFFREGAYRPGTADGRRLLAHELLHTVQNPHGLGALRAGRDLGAVSLPQQAIEREAESAAQNLVRPTAEESEQSAQSAQSAEAVEGAASAVAPGQATPGWLRYATVDADRRRTEALDPATLIDRLANGVLRSLRGDPEDRSGRVRLQLARMAPTVQETVLDRLEQRLPTPVLDRLLEAVEEAERTWPLPPRAATAPTAVPGAAEEIAEERERASTEERRAEEESAAAPREGEDRQEDDGPSAPGDGQDGRAPDSEDQQDGASGGRTGSRDGEESAGRQQERSQERQDDRQSSGQDARRDASDEHKDARNTQEEQKEQDRRDSRDEEQGAQDEAAQEPERQAGEQDPGQSQDPVAEAAGRQVTAPAAVDRSGAEPGERSRTGDDIRAARTMGDPDNQQDADDEPLGLEAESAEGDVEPDADDDAGRGTPAADTASGGDTVTDPRLFERRKRGAPRAPALSLSDGPPAADAVQDVTGAEGGGDTAVHTEEDDTEDRAVQELMDGLTTDDDSTADAGSTSAASTGGGAAATSISVTGKDADNERAAERQEDAEAARRDEEARAADGAGRDVVPSSGEAAGPDRLAKADEEARTRSAGSPSGTQGASDGGSGGAAAGRQGAAGAADRNGTEAGPDTGKEPDRQAGGGTDQAGSVADRDGGGTSEGEGGTEPAPATPGPGGQDVTEGKGDATSPGPVTGPDKVSTPGPVDAPQLAPGNGPSPMSAGPQAGNNTPKVTEAPGPARSAGGSAGSRARPTGSRKQAARQAAKSARRSGGGGGRSASAPAPVRAGGRGGGGRTATAGGSKPKKEAPAPDVSNATPESGLATAGSLEPHQALETLKGVDGAVGRSVDKERSALRKAPPTMRRPSGSPRTVPGGPTPAAPGTYTGAKVARTEAAAGRTAEITGEQKPQGEVPGADVPEPSWWDIALTIGAQLFGKLLKEILPLDDLIDSILGLPTHDEGMRNARVGDAPRLPLEDDSDPGRTDEQSGKLDERKTELHRSGRADAALPMGEDQLYPDVPKETLTAKAAGGKGGAKSSGPRSVSGGVPIESASAVAEHDRGPQIRAGFSEGRQKMGQERRNKDKKATDDRKQHDDDLGREVDASGKKQADARDKGRSDIADSRDRWRKEQDDKVSEIDDKKGKKYDTVRKDIKKKEEDTDKDVDKRTEDDNKKIETEQTTAEQEAERKQNEGKDDADNWLEEAIEKLKDFFETLKNAIKSVFEKARQVVTDLIDTFKQQVFKLIDDARNWVVEQINTFADALIALGDELLADYPAMRDKWRNTIDGARDWAVQKVNEFADALKEVAGKLLDGLCGALLAGLDLLEGGLLAAVDIAETVTVGALEFGAAVVQGLGEWAAIFNDIVSDPGDWISKAGAAAETGARDHLFDEIKTAVKAWFNQKVQEIIGIPMEDFQELLDGGVTAEQMGRMAWDEALPQLPVIIGVLVLEKVVAKLIPGAGWVMAVIDALQTAWGALSEILAAFGLFMDFLKSVKSGNGALPFAKAVAAGVVALLELVYTFLIEGVGRFMGKVADKLGDMLKNLRRKKDKPGGPDAPDQPAAPSRPKDEKPKDEAPSGTDKDADRPTPRKPSPDRTSRPRPGPRPGKRSSPEKKPRPSHTTRPKKRRDDDERREEGRDVNAARRKAKDAEKRTRDEERDARTAGPGRRGPARDTLRPDRRRPGTDSADGRDPASTRPGERRPDDRRTEPDRKDDRRPDPDRDGKRRPGDRPRRARRARQTVKSAAGRARRAARRLHGKARRKLGSRLNDRLRRLRDRWRRNRDRTRDARSRRSHRERSERSRRDTSDITMPTVRYADADDGEQHTLAFHGRGARAPLYVHSTPAEIPAYLDSWKQDLGRPEAKPHKSEQEGFLKQAHVKFTKVLAEQARPLKETDKEKRAKEKRDKERDLKRAMMRFADEARHRVYFDIPHEELQDFADVSPVGDEDTRGSEEHKSKFIGNPSKTLFGGGGQDARKAADGQPPGWDDISDRGFSAKGAWVRMHLLPESLGGKAKGNNLVPARRETNKDFYRQLEGPAYHAVPEPEPIIWYRTRATFHGGPSHVASYIYAEYGGYKKVGGTGKDPKDWEEDEAPRMTVDRSPLPLDPNGRIGLSINGAGSPSINKRLIGGSHEALARHFVDARNELHKSEESLSDVGDVELMMRNYKLSHPTLRLTGLDTLLAGLRSKHEEINWTWEF
ncbi:hypothetical protein C6Y14_35875 [Streptomyces dioscori]|uniref:eCIS core domain-containing protein n=1 Tax=Streptomyces dioscori TaxID=2109333 RepID=A0A2P8PX21_9ACTN|nr:DUF4157 domain-containing protein [Streptomyces dioscori]PSM38534.1 hypothetical protein C6Y14_35875 [Streptomyces dioscori]